MHKVTIKKSPKKLKFDTNIDLFSLILQLLAMPKLASPLHLKYSDAEILFKSSPKKRASPNHQLYSPKHISPSIFMLTKNYFDFFMLFFTSTYNYQLAS